MLEKGIYLPLIAPVLVVVLFVLVGIGLGVSQVHRASQALNLRTEAICQAAASHAVVQREATATFRDLIQDTVDQGLVKGATITSAHITIPTMPRSGCFGDFDQGDCAAAADAPFLDRGNYPDGANIGPLLGNVSACDFHCGTRPSCEHDCKFQGWITGDPRYPYFLANDLQDAGNTVACEVKAVVNSFFYGEKDIVSRVVWTIPVRALTNYDASDPTGTSPGLTLAVAPQMTTLASDPRFRFDSSRYSQEFRDKHDPLFQYDRGVTHGVKAFNVFPPTDQLYPTSYAPPPGITALKAPSEIDWQTTWAHSPIASASQALSVPMVGEYGDLTADAVSSSQPADPVFSDREEMLAACMNPAIAVRNILLETIVELAARHGQLRNHTEILMVPTQNRLLSNGSLSGTKLKTKLPYYINHPVQMVPFGSDLTAPQYQLPYVYYDGGDARSSQRFANPNTANIPGYLNLDPANWYGPPPAPGAVFYPLQGSSVPYGTPAADLGGMINPFAGSGNPLLEHHSLVANQLRICYHLFGGTDHGLQRLDSASTGLDSVMPNNNAFEPIGGGQAYDFNPELRFNVYTGTSSDIKENYWDQLCPWNDPSCVSSTSARPLTASELVAALGSIQKCPYEQGGLDYIDPNTGLKVFNDPIHAGPIGSGVCKKPPAATWNTVTDGPDSVATNDLRPDVFGTLLYAAGIDPSAANVLGSRIPAPPSAPFEATVSPGIFPLKQIRDDWRPFQYVNAYVPAQNLKTHILIVTSQRLSRGEVNAIKYLRTTVSPELNNRAITIVYIPTDEIVYDQTNGVQVDTAAHNNAIANFKEAFGITSDTFTTASTGAALFVFSPLLAKYNRGQGSVHVDQPSPIPHYDPSSQPIWEIYRDYWHYLLTDSSQNVQQAAKNIFYSRILKKDMKF